MSKRTAARAQLDQDPVRAAARRQEKVQAFSRDMAVQSLEKRVLAAEESARKLEDELRKKDAQIDSLESDRRWLADREREERETKERERAQWREDKANLEEQLREHRTTGDTAREELEELQDAHIAQQRKYKNTQAKYESQISISSRKIDMLEAQLRAATTEAEKKGAEVGRLQGQLDDALAKRAEENRRLQEEQNWTVIREELHRQAQHTRKLEAENARMISDIRVLRTRAETAEVLREEKLSLEKKLRNAEQYRDQVARLQAEVDAARTERAKWAEQQTTTPTSLISELSDLRLQYASLLEAQGALVVELRQREADLNDANTTIKQAEDQVSTLFSQVSELQAAAAKRERRVALAEREVSFLNALLATYSTEEDGTKAEEGDEAQAARNKELKGLIEGYKTECRELEQQLRVLRQAKAVAPPADVKPSVGHVDEDTRQALADAQQVVRRQENKIEELEQTLFELRGTIAQGNHVPPRQRVLCLAENPLQEWADLQQANLDRLKAENVALLQRLAELDSRGPSIGAGDLVPRESLERLEHENLQLQETVAQKQKRFDRLKEVYTSKSQEFKDAVSMLLGFKFSFYQNGQCKVTSIYDVSAKFTFGPSPDNPKQLELVDGGHVAGLNMESVVQNYLITRGSIPCFLAAITLECQDQYTGQRTGYTESGLT
ncbi:hypothetical protein AURDEDRAFT_109823 [Auricularia subglabra TFB-10046 SS5]|nr:hypothetical protein AURDEDRAFT_109823 [Auricularia subglabra TFB-10046 SS5]